MAKKFIYLMVTGGLVVLLTLGFHSVRPFTERGKPLLIAYHVFADGAEACITQRYGGLLELYKVSFYYRPNGCAYWNWYYIDHEDLYWHSGDIIVDAKSHSALILRKGKEVAIFRIDEEVLYRIREQHSATGKAITGTPLENPSH